MTEDSSAAVLTTLMRLEQSVTSKLRDIEARLVALEHRVSALDARESQDAAVTNRGIELLLEVVRSEARRDTAVLLGAIRDARGR